MCVSLQYARVRALCLSPFMPRVPSAPPPCGANYAVLLNKNLS